jgi:glycogen debranching enzyme, archaeal type, putative
LKIEACSDEWLLTFGTGGYASSTFCGYNARTYHGLLVAPTNPPHRRFLLLSKIEESLIYGDEIPFSTNRYVPNVTHPKGYEYIQSFTWGRNYVSWRYSVEGVTVAKEVVACQGVDCVIVRYSAEKGRLKLCPLVGYRSHHDVMRRGQYYFETSFKGKEILVLRDGTPHLRVSYSNGRPYTSGYWYYNFQYDVDRSLGNHYVEDLFNPFCIEAEGSVELVFYPKRPGYAEKVESPQDEISLLREATRAFVVKGKEGYAIIAGYHWFDEWGRDTFISMEGLLLLDGGFEQAKSIFRRYLSYCNEGLLPNHITPGGEPFYLGVDVTLWAVNALYKYFLKSKDKDFVREALRAIEDCLWYYVRGTRVLYWKDGLLYHSGAPRTWMDASFDGTVVTPREGAAVDVNALLYNALMAFNDMRESLGDEPVEEFSSRAGRLKSAFAEAFTAPWGLYDYISPEGVPDQSVRPNMLFAYSLPFPVGPEEMVNVVKNTVEAELLRPYGLSTLSRRDPKYRPTWRGPRAERDLAYHNGVIWPWLLRAYVDFVLRYFREEALELLHYLYPLIETVKSRNGFLPELFEDVPPYRPAGAFAQAWSVAEVYRALRALLGAV